MDYRRDKKSQTAKYAFFTLLAGVLGYILFFTSMFSVLAGALHSLAIPLWGIERSMANAWGGLTAHFSGTESLAEENKDLRERISLLEAEHAEYASLVEENTELKQVVGRYEHTNIVLAGVLAKPNMSPYDTFIVDAGERDGVRIGDTVLFLGGAGAGHVAEVFADSSKVRLFSSYGETTDAVLGSAGIAVSLSGRGAGNFEIELPRDIEVAVGDRIVSPGLDARLLGTVFSISGTSSDSFKQVLVRGPANIFTAMRVEILPSGAGAEID